MPPQRHLPPDSQPKVRQRGSKACGPCRRRKIKCDGVEPCSGCSVYGYDCVYSDGSLQRKAAASAPSLKWSATSQGKTEMQTSVPDLRVGGKSGSCPSNSYMASESVIHCPFGTPLLHQSLKTRFTTAHSAIAHPRSLGISLGMDDPPRLQSFGWNAGTRPEPKINPGRSICDIISFDQMKQYAAAYFNEVHLFFGILNQDLFKTRSAEFWFSQKQGSDFEACICYVVALGSFFSGPEFSPVEADIVEHGRVLLDLSTAHAPALLSMKHVIAWVLRAIYLRSTTRPHLSWMASCSAVHVAEAIGLHREINETQLRRDTPREVTALEIDMRRRIFWITMAQHHFFASEYGRTAVHLDMTGCKSFPPQAGDLTSEVVAIMQSVPIIFPTGDIPGTLDVLTRAIAIPAKSPFLSLLRADACFCIFRKARSIVTNMPFEVVSSLLEVIRVALGGVTFLCSMQHPWWNVVGTPFHSICILLAIETSESFAMIPLGLEVLRNAATLFDSYLSREALRTAHALVSAAREKRSQEMTRVMESFDRGLSVLGEIPQEPDAAIFASGSSNSEWLTHSDLGFTDLLDLGSYYGLEM